MVDVLLQPHIPGTEQANDAIRYDLSNNLWLLMSATQIFLSLWVLALVLAVAFAITASRLVFRLRELYPAIYEQVGSPRAFSRKTEFLWRLRSFNAELAPKDKALTRTSLALLVIFWIVLIAGVVCAVLP
jgi:hypothetical protein